MSSEFAIKISVSDNSKDAPMWDIKSDLEGKVTLKDFVTHFRNGHIRIARSTLAQEQSDGFDKNPRVRTDSRFGRPDVNVRPFGKIQYYAKVASLDAIKKMYQEIVNKSPVTTGQYVSSNYVFFNSRLVARGYAELVAWLKFASNRGFKDGDKIRFINVMPYASMLEYKGVRRNSRGRTTHKAKSGKSRRTKGKLIKKPNGVYYLAYRAIRRKFRGVTQNVSFQFIPNGFAGINILPAPPFRTSYKKSGLPYVYPSVVISLTEQGLIQ